MSDQKGVKEQVWVGKFDEFLSCRYIFWKRHSSYMSWSRERLDNTRGNNQGDQLHSGFPSLEPTRCQHSHGKISDKLLKNMKAKTDHWVHF